jgi:hypothetical protein
LAQLVGVSTIAAAAGRALAKQKYRLAMFAAAVVAPLLGLVTLILLTGDAASGVISFFGRILGSINAWIVAAVGAVWWAFYLVSDQTTWSMHPFYKRRLSSAFAIRRDSRASSKPLNYDEFQSLSKYPRLWPSPSCETAKHECDPGAVHKCTEAGCRHRCGPELLVCAAVNISEDGVTPPGRKSGSFVFSARDVGGPEIGWVPTEDFERAMARRRREDITLPAAVAISGAALSPAMGKMSRGGVAPLLSLLNVRLGVWLPNPRWVQRLVEEGMQWHERPRARYLLKEILGIYRRDDPFLYVTDGGHWENLGLVELLRRGCTEIYCFDASGDHVDTFFTIGEAVALARSELGVEIDIDPEPLEPTEETRKKGRSPRDFVTGTFRYREPLMTGRLVFAKAAVTDEMPWDVKAYGEKDPSFPTASTIDQLYTDQKFEAYRALGASTAARAVREMKRGPISSIARAVLNALRRSIALREGTHGSS